MNYPHLSARIFNTPLLIHPQKLDAILAGLGPRLLGNAHGVQPDLTGTASAALLPAEMFSTRRDSGQSDAYAVSDGVAVITAYGALVHRSRFDLAKSTSILGYNQLAMQLEQAMTDSDIHAVVLSFDSPGGEAQGAFELADRIAALRGKKPMVAMADGLAASAAYLAAAAADEIVLTPSAYVGSIGVVMRHVDFSQALGNDGIKVTHIYAGDHKVDGNPYEPLPESVRAGMQAEIDGLYQMFIQSVATHRGMDAEAVRKTQAQVYRGAAALNASLADRIGTTDQIITELAAKRPRIHSVGPTARAQAPSGAPSMTTETTATTTPASAADLAAARAEGAQAERNRITSILGHERASAHMGVATQCVSSGLSTEQAHAILGALPAATSTAGATAAPVSAKTNPFASAMAAVPNPVVSGVEAAVSTGVTNDKDLALALATQAMQSFLGNKS
ncbi:MAG: S49 family peptidase [Burkholderiaceae bacterium]|nr:S49 family peptidase [Burkholderiaceae bacterium]